MTMSRPFWKAVPRRLNIPCLVLFQLPKRKLYEDMINKEIRVYSGMKTLAHSFCFCLEVEADLQVSESSGSRVKIMSKADTR